MELFNTPLGEMEVIEHYLFYDRPYIFLCEDKVGNQYVSHLVDDDEQGEKWFFVPSSRLRVEMVRTGKMSLRQSVQLSELGWIWEVNVPYDGSTGTALVRKCETLSEMDLPGENTFLNFPENRLPKFKADAAKEAEQLFRDVLFLSLNDGQHTQLIHADYLGAILLRSQGLLHTLAHRNGANRGRIPKSTKEEATMFFAGDFAASVGIKLEAKYNGIIDLPIHDALRTFLDLLSAGNDKNKLIGVLSNLQTRAIARYRFLLQALEQAGVTFKAEWGSPRKGKRSASLNLEEIRGAIEIMNLDGDDMTQRIQMRGDLVGFLSDKSKNRFSFEFVSNEGERYKGALSQDILNQIEDGFSINVPAYGIVIQLDETIEINPATSEERITYTLVSIN